MKNYRKLACMLTFFLLAYLMLGLGSLATSRQEIFPFFSWFLFAKVPSQIEKYAIVILPVQDERDEQNVQGTQEIQKNFSAEGIFFEEAGSKVRRPHSVTAQRVIQNLGEAIESKDAENAALYRRKLEERYLYPSTNYQVVRIRYNPLTRVHARDLKRIESTAEKKISYGIDRISFLGTYQVGVDLRSGL